jgi:PKD repeat protein
MTRVLLAGLTGTGAIGALAALPTSAAACNFLGAPPASLTSSDPNPHVGETVTFTATASNYEGGFSWLYGDESAGTAPVPGPAITSHTYTRSGLFIAKVHVQNCAGESNATVDETVTGINPKLLIIALHISPYRFRVTGRGTTVSYKLSDAARTTFVVQQALTGVRDGGGRCVPVTSLNRNRPHCTRYVRRGSFTLAGKSGDDRFRFMGRVNGKRLSPGFYRLAATARTSSGLTSDTVDSGRFQIVP